MNDIASKTIVLKLNKGWQVVGTAIVADTLVDLVTGVVMALDINYAKNPDGTFNTKQYEYVNPVGWDEWINLPVREGDLVIHTPKMAIRVPTVVIAKNCTIMPMKKFKGKPTKEALFHRDNGKDIYTGKPLRFDEATIDHIVPRFRGGKDVYENTGLTTSKLNNKKGHKLNDEIGLIPKFSPTLPRPVPVSKTIRNIQHEDWEFFITKN